MSNMQYEWINISEDPASAGYVTGALQRCVNFPSQIVSPRHVDVWLPPSYTGKGATGYPVLYMQDGQALFEPGHAFTNQEWGVDETMTRLIKSGDIREAIVVGIWNTDLRFREYQPGKPFLNLSPEEQKVRQRLDTVYGGGPLGDDYLAFLVDELKPFIDRTFCTLPDRSNTCVMGSSMGGLISLYAITEYPTVFGRAACLSTHFPILLEDSMEVPPILLRYFKEQLPRGEDHHIYFDYGTETHDAWYEPHQQAMDGVMQAIGYTREVNWVTRKFVGAEHSEVAWRERLHIPLMFLLGSDLRGQN